MELLSVPIDKPEDVNMIFGQAHFIKTVEDLHETLVGCVPEIEFGLAFCEASGPSLVRSTGTSKKLKELAEQKAYAIAAGHTFIIFLGNAFPINVLNAVKMVPEVCRIFCATANQVQVIVMETDQGRGVLGVIDGEKSKGIESEEDVADRLGMLRKFGYKFG